MKIVFLVAVIAGGLYVASMVWFFCGSTMACSRSTTIEKLLSSWKRFGMRPDSAQPWMAKR